MTDKKTIWHEPDEKPTNGKELVIETKRCGYESYELSYNEDTGEYAPWSWVQKDIIKWCFLDDLLEQSSKIERLEDVICDIYSTLNLVMNDSALRTSDDGFTLLYKLKNKITQALEKASQ